jgi:hypothetical protein
MSIAAPQSPGPSTDLNHEVTVLQALCHEFICSRDMRILPVDIDLPTTIPCTPTLSVEPNLILLPEPQYRGIMYVLTLP